MQAVVEGFELAGREEGYKDRIVEGVIGNLTNKKGLRIMGISHSENEKRIAVLKVLKPQFPNCFGGRLSLAMVEQSLKDLSSTTVQPVDKSSARRYLEGDMYHVALAGVEPEWVRKIIRQAGIEISRPARAA